MYSHPNLAHHLWAPAIQEVKTGKGKYKYYLYYSANPKAGGGKEIGVAVSDSPTGQFVDSGKSIVNTIHDGCHGQQIDVDVFVDPRSKKPYLYWGNGYMAGAELQKDMTTIKPQTLKVLTPKGAHCRIMPIVRLRTCSIAMVSTTLCGQ